MPTASAIVVRLQCVALDGVSCTVFAITFNIKELEDRIPRVIASDERLSEAGGVLRSILGTSPVASTMLIAEMPEIGTIIGEEAASLTGLAPVAHDSGTLRRKRAIAARLHALRHVMF